MRYSGVLLFTLVLALTILASFSSSRKLVVTSTAFANNGQIPAKYSCEGEEMSPPLQVENIPADTRSLAVTLHDPDAPMQGGFTHWVVWDIPVTGEIPENFKGGVTGINTIAKHSYKGICPWSGANHYHFTVYALDTKLNMDMNMDKNALEKRIKGHVLAEGELVGTYEIKR